MRNVTMQVSTQQKPVTDTAPISQKKYEEVIQAILPHRYFLANTIEELEQIKLYKEDYYSDERSSVKAFHEDGLDQYSYVIYGTNEQGEITGTSRLLLDGEWGFPEEDILPNAIQKMREKDIRLAELGRLLVTEDKVNGLRTHYKLIHEMANIIGIDKVLVVMKQQHIPSHKKMMAVEVLSMDMGNSWDEEQAPLCLIAWDVKAPQPKFHQWINRDKSAFTPKKWDGYSDSHLGAFISPQKEVYQYIASQISGHVLDLGCGSGRVMAYVQDNLSVASYTGVDASIAMIERAGWLKEELGFNKAQLIHADIADVQVTYDSIFSIHSFYSWPDQQKLLAHINNLLADDGTFILVTPNESFDEERLSHVAKQELLGHPQYEAFMAINFSIAETAKAEGVYVPIDTLIEQVKQAGFSIKTAHNEFFLGGAAYLELGKGS